jgi:hypothetical protein
MENKIVIPAGTFKAGNIVEFSIKLKQIKIMNDPILEALNLISKFVRLGLTLATSKECALIVVDEIIESNPMIKYGESDAGTEYESNKTYWYDVKQEIEKL